jgi:hypothetical protein
VEQSASRASSVAITLSAGADAVAAGADAVVAAVSARGPTVVASDTQAANDAAPANANVDVALTAAVDHHKGDDSGDGGGGGGGEGEEGQISLHRTTSYDAALSSASVKVDSSSLASGAHSNAVETVDDKVASQPAPHTSSYVQKLADETDAAIAATGNAHIHQLRATST